MKKSFYIFIICAVAVSFLVIFMQSKASENFSADSESSVIAASETETDNKPLPKMKNPRILVKKSERKLQVFDDDKLIKTYKIALGFAPVGDKEIEGDGKTPEGEFYIFTKNEKSNFYLSLGVSYPSTDDAERGFRQNLISKTQRDSIIEAIKNRQTPPQKTKLGGEIYIHGNGSKTDWTLGCVALENEEMKQLFEAIPVGASVRIEP